MFCLPPTRPEDSRNANGSRRESPSIMGRHQVAAGSEQNDEGLESWAKSRRGAKQTRIFSSRGDQMILHFTELK
jgi:hypothetical protein